MSGLETAIRNALARSERDDAHVRARIYQSARQALDAGLKKQEITDPGVIDRQRRGLEDKIREIEIEERQRIKLAEADRATRAAEEVRLDAPVMDGPAEQLDEPSLGGQTRDASRPTSEDEGAFDGLAAMRAEPASDRLAPQPPAEPPQKASRFGRKTKAPKSMPADDTPSAVGPAPKVPGEKRRRQRRGLLSRLFIYTTFFAFLALGGWWAYSGGLFLTPEQRDTSVPNPPPAVQEEDFTGAAGQAFNPQQGFSDDWLEVYAASSKTPVTPGAEASAEVVAMADGPALRITSRSPGAGGDVAIPVPVEVLREMAGKTSTIALTLQAVGNAAVQLAVRCDFTSLGTCSRHRVMAMQERADTLFRVTFDRTLAPTQAGRIYVNSDILGGSQPILLYSVRVLPGQ
ncbi:hypothetical protein [Affinirhizobium pseudoryzae]|uniref:hypothetical protein n=1 Tax=Allorhizobium pseudoryzae TaxID=379684 RepID=UPI0013ECD3DB|nr:hypothetical protein [Allorhizobium pseudoryzae]